MNRTRWGEVETHIKTFERGIEQENNKSATKRRKHKSIVANKKRESIHQQHHTIVK